MANTYVSGKAKGMQCALWSRMTDENKHRLVRVKIAKWIAEFMATRGISDLHKKALAFVEFFSRVKAEVDATHIFPNSLNSLYNRRTGEMIDMLRGVDSDAAMKIDACL